MLVAAWILAAGLSGIGSPALRSQVDEFLAAEAWPDVARVAEAWTRLPDAGRDQVVRLLAGSLTDCRRVGLKSPDDVFIARRLATGDLKFMGHGLVVRQDLFVAGGRAAWGIERLLGVDLPVLDGGLTVDEWAERAATIAARVRK